MKKSILVNEILAYVAPLMIAAGRYALNIQARVASQPAKTGPDNPFFSALTDADLSVQAFMEVALLARFPEISFFGEEHERSLNMKYFPKKGELCVYLDPIDGTRYFMDNLKEFNVILCIADEESIIGAMVYVPSYGVCLKAVREQGAYLLSEIDINKCLSGTLLNLSKNPEILVTYDAPDLREKLRSSFEIVDIAAEYTPSQGCLATNSILLGQSSALLGRHPSLIDWGAMAFIVQEAGGVVSDFHGNPLPPLSHLCELRFPELLASTNRELHTRIIDQLNS